MFTTALLTFILKQKYFCGTPLRQWFRGCFGIAEDFPRIRLGIKGKVHVVKESIDAIIVSVDSSCQGFIARNRNVNKVYYTGLGNATRK